MPENDAPGDARIRQPVSELHARHIDKSFDGVQVLHDVDFDVVGGRVVALLGENGAGKSTLVRILAGDHQPTSGEIELGGATHAGFTPSSARAAGVRMIFQELNDAPDLTVAENIALGRWSLRRGLISWRGMRTQASAVLRTLGSSLDPLALLSSLRVGERQLVEIARAISDDVGFLILDEPTAALSSEESRRLFSVIRKLREGGVGIVYITHRLDEIAEIADDIVVMRDGRVVAKGTTSALSRQDIISAMLGGSVASIEEHTPRATGIGEVRLKAEGLSSTAYSDVDLVVRSAEIVVLYGKLGSGASEFVDTIFGLVPVVSGELAIDGEQRRFAGPRAAIDSGIGYLASDRQREGAFMDRSIFENFAAPSWSRLSRLGFLGTGSEKGRYQRWQRTLNIKDGGQPERDIAQLSGGNQQKVLLARWLERESRLLLLSEPTRGVDIGARAEIYTSLRMLADNGTAILVTTSDYEEVIQLADQAVIFRDGHIVSRLEQNEITADRLLNAVGG